MFWYMRLYSFYLFDFVLVSIVGVRDFDLFALSKTYGVSIFVSKIVTLVKFDWSKGPIVIEFSLTKLNVRLLINISCVMWS